MFQEVLSQCVIVQSLFGHAESLNHDGNFFTPFLRSFYFAQTFCSRSGHLSDGFNGFQALQRDELLTSIFFTVLSVSFPQTAVFIAFA